MERARCSYAGAQIIIHDGDITRVRVDAMITVINSSLDCSSGIESEIWYAAGAAFHMQANAAMPLSDGQTVVAKQNCAHGGAWGDVVFVVDDCARPLHEIVRSALAAAGNGGYRTVSLPAIRTGVLLGAAGQNAQQTVAEIILGLRRYLDETSGTSIEEIHIVIFRDPAIIELLATIPNAARA